MILDTTFLIDLMNNDESARHKAEVLFNHGSLTYISTVTIFELHSGLARSGKSSPEQNKVRNVLDQQNIIPIDSTIAERAGDIHGALITQGQMLGSMDCLIAATALLNRETVLTRNVKDFQRIPGLKIESY
ncbi:PIN domain-containing protein [Candidatus Woesearchaeota archaeon]|nr:PIN domain-containing protein [Candidatus Woesearchaeota archaeon]